MEGQNCNNQAELLNNINAMVKSAGLSIPMPISKANFMTKLIYIHQTI